MSVCPFVTTRQRSCRKVMFTVAYLSVCSRRRWRSTSTWLLLLIPLVSHRWDYVDPLDLTCRDTLDMCDGIFSGNMWLTFLYWWVQSQGLWPWQCATIFSLHDVVSARASTSVHSVPTLEHGDVKCVTMNVHKVAQAVAHIIYRASPPV